MSKFQKISSLFLAGLVSAGTVFSQSKIDFVEYTLPNGLHVILHENHSVPVVAVSVMYHVGSKNEQTNRTGFAHFFEHLLFEGTENIKRGEFGKYISEAGGVNNAYTSQDKTYYYEILPSNQLELGLWLESERLMHAKIETVGVETQRQVVKEEKSQRMDNQPYGNIMTEVFKASYKQHPYRWMPIGSIEDLDAAQLNEFMDFYKMYYVPNNATLSIAGDIDIEKTKALIEAYFAPIPRGKDVPKVTVVEPAQKEEVKVTAYDKNINLPAVVYSYHIPGQGTDDFYALQMLNYALANGKSARLSRELVDKQQVAAQAGSFPFELEHPGLLVVFGIAGLGINQEMLDKAMEAEVEKIKLEGITDKEYEKIRNQVEATFATSNSSMAGIAENLANYHVFYDDANLINTEMQRYLKVTKEDIKRVANKYLVKSNRTVVYYLPELKK